MVNWIAVGINIAALFWVALKEVQGFVSGSITTSTLHVFIYCYAFNFIALVFMLSVATDVFLEIFGTIAFALSMLLHAAQYDRFGINFLLNFGLPLSLVALATEESVENGETAALEAVKILGSISTVSLFVNTLTIPFDSDLNDRVLGGHAN